MVRSLDLEFKDLGFESHRGQDYSDSIAYKGAFTVGFKYSLLSLIFFLWYIFRYFQFRCFCHSFRFYCLLSCFQFSIGHIEVFQRSPDFTSGQIIYEYLFQQFVLFRYNNIAAVVASSFFPLRFGGSVTNYQFASTSKLPTELSHTKQIMKQDNEIKARMVSYRLSNGGYSMQLRTAMGQNGTDKEN